MIHGLIRTSTRGHCWHYLVSAFIFSDKCPGKEGNSKDLCPKVLVYILTLKTPVPHLCCQAVANHPGSATFLSNLTHLIASCQRHSSSVSQALIGRIFVPASIIKGTCHLLTLLGTKPVQALSPLGDSRDMFCLTI